MCDSPATVRSYFSTDLLPLLAYHIAHSSSSDPPCSPPLTQLEGLQGTMPTDIGTLLTLQRVCQAAYRACTPYIYRHIRIARDGQWESLLRGFLAEADRAQVDKEKKDRGADGLDSYARARMYRAGQGRPDLSSPLGRVTWACTFTLRLTVSHPPSADNYRLLCSLASSAKEALDGRLLFPSAKTLCVTRSFFTSHPDQDQEGRPTFYALTTGYSFLFPLFAFQDICITPPTPSVRRDWKSLFGTLVNRLATLFHFPPHPQSITIHGLPEDVDAWYGLHHYKCLRFDLWEPRMPPLDVDAEPGMHVMADSLKARMAGEIARAFFEHCRAHWRLDGPRFSRAHDRTPNLQISRLFPPVSRVEQPRRADEAMSMVIRHMQEILSARLGAPEHTAFEERFIYEDEESGKRRLKGLEILPDDEVCGACGCRQSSWA